MKRSEDITNIQDDNSINPWLVGLLIALMIVQGITLSKPFMATYAIYMKSGVLICLLVSFAYLIRQGRLKILSSSPIFISLVGFAFLQLLSILWATHPSLVWASTVDWVLYASIFLLIANIRSHKDIFGAALLGVISWNVILAYGLLLQILLKNQFSLDLETINSIGVQFSFNNNYLTSLFVIFLPVLSAMRRTRYRSWATILGILILCIVPLLSCRGSTMALIALIVYSLYFMRKQDELKKLIATLTGIVLVIISTFLGFVENKDQYLDSYNPFSTLLDDTGDDRLEIWSNSFKLIKEKPFFGHGAGHWKSEILKYGVGDYHKGIEYSHAHNWLIQTASEVGLVGLGIVLILFISIFNLGRIRKNPDIITMGIALIVLTSFYGIYQSNTITSLSHLLVVFGFLGSYIDPHKVNDSKYGWLRVLILTLWMSLLCLVVCVASYRVYSCILIRKGVNAKEVIEKTRLLKLVEKKVSRIFYGFHGNRELIALKGGLYWQIGHKKHGVKLMKRSLILHPYDKKVWYQYGIYLKKSNDPKKSINAMRKVIDLDPGHVNAHLQLARLGKLINRPDAFNQGMQYYYDNLEPLFARAYSDDLIARTNQLGRKFWLVRCKNIDFFQELLD